MGKRNESYRKRGDTGDIVLKIISFGAGVNSVAMTIMLYKRGEIYPCVFADTMAEHPETYCYMDYFERKFMSKYGQKIVRLNPINTPEWFMGKAKGSSLYDYCIKDRIVPFMRFRWCTDYWKVKPINKFMSQNNISECLIAFAYDERHRAKDNQKNLYPLVEEEITRNKCKEIISDVNLSIPRKSGCFFCPFQKISEWQQLFEQYPLLLEKAITLEQNAKLKRRDSIGLRPDGISIQILKERFEAKGGDLFPDYDYEELTPCMCIT